VACVVTGRRPIPDLPDGPSGAVHETGAKGACDLTNHDSPNAHYHKENTDTQPSTVDTDNWWLLSTVDTAAVRARYRSMWRPDTPDPAGVIVAVLGEVPALCAEVERLCRLLGQARYAYANLAAAAYATLSALSDGEADPWWYLRDELGTGPGWGR
jgi:hypothetical protein